MPSWLVTGGSGFVGRHLLADLLANPHPNVWVVTAGRNCPPGWNPERFRQVDLRNREALKDLIGSVRPSCVFHLAGKTPPGTPDDFDNLNTTLTTDLLDVLQAHDRACRVVLVGSAAELGPVPVDQLPVGEDHPCQPVEPYGWSKWRATLAGLTVSPPIEVVVARVFNPIGPGLPTSQALGRFAGLLAQASSPVRLTVGNLETRRDFVDVRDVAGALVGLATRGRSGEVYHVGTGLSHPVRDGLDRLIGLSGREVTVEVDPALARTHGPADSRADVRKIHSDIGWSPRISWERSLIDLWHEANGSIRPGLTDPRASV